MTERPLSLEYWVLDGHQPRLGTLEEYAAMWKVPESRWVAKDKVGDAEVSTVFLGVDHNFGRQGPPILFETMIFGGSHAGDMWRCSTWDEAEAGHRRAVDALRAGRDLA